LQYKAGVRKESGALFHTGYIKIQTFKSEAVVREPVRKGNLVTLSMVMLDYDYDAASDVFSFDDVFFSGALQQSDWELSFPIEKIGKQVMAVFIDVFGNEAREVIPGETFGVRRASASPRSTRKRKHR
jgi:site-specific DNA-methyltransferase (adenine-specific)/adenine-specific DNA-methyltransferase